jgi:hypothetical protein
MELSKINNYNIKSELYEKGQVTTKLIQRDSLNTDAIASLSDQVMKIMREMEALKNATTGNIITTTNSE